MTEDKADWTEPHKPKRWPIAIGIVLTIGWIGFLAIYCFVMSSVFATLPPNEFGDFLAGAFAPLAFAWLVLGFWQQGVELRHSAHALRMQAKELQESVVQQRDLVNVTRDQLAHERERIDAQERELHRTSQPIFEIMQVGVMRIASTAGWQFQLRLLNHGRTCTRVTIYEDFSGRKFNVAKLETGSHHDFSLDTPDDSDSEFFIDIHFRDARLRDGSTRFTTQKEGSTLWAFLDEEIDD